MTRATRRKKEARRQSLANNFHRFNDPEVQPTCECGNPCPARSKESANKLRQKYRAGKITHPPTFWHHKCEQCNRTSAGSIRAGWLPIVLDDQGKGGDA